MLGRGGFYSFSRNHKGSHTHQLQLLPRDIIGAAQELEKDGRTGGGRVSLIK